jgi:hypothetical protein
MSDTWLVLAEKGLLLPDLDATPVAERGLCVIDGRILTTDNAGVEGQHMSHDSIENNGLLVQHNMAAAVAPVVGDDNTAGYEVGSFWYDTTADIVYTCVDASTGAAVWLQVSNAAGASVNEAALALNWLRHRTGNTTYREVSRGVIDTSKFPAGTATFSVEIITAAGGGGSDINLQDITNAAALGTLTGETTTGIKTATVTLPGSPGLIVWALQHRVNATGTGNSEIAGATLQSIE